MTHAAQLDTALDSLVDTLVPKLIARGFVVAQPRTSAVANYRSDFDDATCRAFVDPEHIGDAVLERAGVFFGELESKGEVSSTDLVAALNLKGARSVSAALTNAMKKSARRLGVRVPWLLTSTSDGTRTVWKDRDGIAARMVKAIAQERNRRGLP